MKKGKIGAQAAHASELVFYPLYKKDTVVVNGQSFRRFELLLPEGSPELFWKESNFKKILLQVDTKEELIELIEKAKIKGILNSIVVDEGLTCFKGIPTVTCGAIGPASSEEIDLLTGHLKLL